MSAARQPVGLTPLVVSLAGAAFLLNTSQDKVRELLAAGHLQVVPHLSSARKISISVAELQRFAAVNPAKQAYLRTHLAPVADAGHLDIDRALLGLASFALGVIAAISPLAVTVYVALIAVCAFAASWLVVHELRERGRLRDPHRDRVLADPADLPGATCRRVEVVHLDHIVVPGPFSRAGTRK